MHTGVACVATSGAGTWQRGAREGLTDAGSEFSNGLLEKWRLALLRHPLNHTLGLMGPQLIPYRLWAHASRRGSPDSSDEGHRVSVMPGYLVARSRRRGRARLPPILEPPSRFWGAPDSRPMLASGGVASSTSDGAVQEDAEVAGNSDVSGIKLGAIKRALREQRLTELASWLASLRTSELVRILERLTRQDRAIAYRLLPNGSAQEAFEALDPGPQGDLPLRPTRLRRDAAPT